MKDMNRKIAVIGGGAAGMMAAVTAAASGSRVVIYEKNDRVGKKLLVTGNGKCNLSNADMDISHYYTDAPEKVIHILEKFSVADTMEFFADAGLMIRDKNGYLYPAAEQASVVLDILRLQLCHRGVLTICGCEVTAVEKTAAGFEITARPMQQQSGAQPTGSTHTRPSRERPNGGMGQDRYDRVIMTCGSRAALKPGEDFNGYRLAASVGHQIVPVVPALVQCRCQEGYLKALAGVRCQAAVKLFIDGKAAAAQRGELQFTDYGISGIPVLQFSRTAAYAVNNRQTVTVEADFFPDYDRAALALLFRERRGRAQNAAGMTVADFVLGMAHKKINQVILKLCGYRGTERAADLGEKEAVALLSQYQAFRLHITAVNSFNQAQVCAGGIAMAEVDEHLESRIVPGLYFAGEILDVDGQCGGYNLQWAWSGGHMAGWQAANK